MFSVCFTAQVSVYSVPAEKHLRTITLDRQHTHATTVVGLSFRWGLRQAADPAQLAAEAPTAFDSEEYLHASAAG
jgi:hypothetical protein